MFILQIALVKKHNNIFEYLLDKFHQFWPATIFDWFKEKFQSFDNFSQDHVLEVIRIFLRSKTAVSVFGGLTCKKQKIWIHDFVSKIETEESMSNNQALHRAIK